MKPKLIKPVTNPRYDQIYEEGIAWLDGLAWEQPMTEAEQNLREVCCKLGNSEASFDYKDNIIREVALATLKDIRPYLVLAHYTAEARHDNGEGEDYMSGAMYEIMQETERLIEQIDLLLQVANE